MNKTHIIVSAFNEDKSEFIEAFTNISYVSKYFNVIKNKLFDCDNLENIDLYFTSQLEKINHLYKNEKLNKILSVSIIELYTYAVYFYYKNKLSNDVLNDIRKRFDEIAEDNDKVYYIVDSQYNLEEEDNMQTRVQHIIFEIFNNYNIKYVLIVGSINTKIKCFLNNAT